MTNKSFQELMSDYLHNRLNEEELSTFLRLLQQEEHRDSFNSIVDGLFAGGVPSRKMEPERKAALFQKIMETPGKGQTEGEGKVVPMAQRSRGRAWTRIAVAAAIMGLLAMGTYFWLTPGETPQVARTENETPRKKDVLPGSDKAVLTLADGSAIQLDEAGDGTLAQQGPAKVVKGGGKLSYEGASAPVAKVVYNTIATPRGGQYHIELTDGSKVWLNAASSLRYPAAFGGAERRVEVKGEAYFEVAKNRKLPFVVAVNGSEVRVLGTHFNVMAYAEEGMVKTTLLEGSVKVVSGRDSGLLRPGEQAQLEKEGVVKVVSGVDVAEEVAWKEGRFQFKGDSLEEVMRQLSRWYDVEVVYRKKVTERFYLELPRNTPLPEVLKVLELTGDHHFDLNGRQIIVR